MQARTYAIKNAEQAVNMRPRIYAFEQDVKSCVCGNEQAENSSVCEQAEIRVRSCDMQLSKLRTRGCVSKAEYDMKVG